MVIQLGAILALISVYAAKLWHTLFHDPHRDPARCGSSVSVLLAFLPAVVVGILAHDFIKTVLFETPMLIAVMLIVGGVVLLVVDRGRPRRCMHDATRCRSARRWSSGSASAWPWCRGSAGPGRRSSAR